MGNVVLVAHQELQGVLAGGKRHLGFCLPAAKVQVIVVVRNGFIQRREIGVDQKVMMAGICALCPCRADAHVPQTEMDHRLRFERVAILHVDEINRGVRRCVGRPPS